ncbi:MAG: hypothetical protein JWM87_1243 [Candidatus Eremiobacteraeota bacterium]|nr:hypothetical protein [Candidatus Eremiobacteraeota bacterium]
MSETAAKPEDAQPLFEAFLTSRGLLLDRMIPDEGIDAVLEFFKTQRFDVPGGDSLVFQFGTNDWDDGPYFDFDLTRQLALEKDRHVVEDDADEDDGKGMWQLSLTFRFAPAPELEALGADDYWCESHERGVVSEFHDFIRLSPAYLAVAPLTAESVELEHEDPG